MTAPDWAALVRQTRDRIDQAEKTARDATPGPWGDPSDVVYGEFGYCVVGCPAGETEDSPRGRADARQIASWGSPDVALRMAAWARDVLERHVLGTDGCWECFDGWPCRDVRAVLRAWVPDLLTAAGVEL